MILTLTEKVTVTSPDYYFVFTHVTTKDQVTFTLSDADDESDYKSRYNKFTIDPSNEFDGQPVGEWHYEVYENDADGELLEQGKLLLDRGEDFSYDKYDSTNSFKTYNG